MSWIRKSLWSPDYPGEELPKDPEHCEVFIQFDLGRRGVEGAENFNITIVTPSVLEEDLSLRGRKGIIVMGRFSWEETYRFVDNLIGSIKSADWDGAIRELCQNVNYEYESEFLSGENIPLAPDARTDYTTRARIDEALQGRTEIEDAEPILFTAIGKLFFQETGGYFERLLITLAMAGAGAFILYQLYWNGSMESGWGRGLTAMTVSTLFFSKLAHTFNSGGPILAFLLALPLVFMAEL